MEAVEHMEILMAIMFIICACLMVAISIDPEWKE